MVMVFIINNVKDAERRRNLVLSTMQLGLLDLLDDCFEVYVDTPERLMDIVFNKVTPGSIGGALGLQSLTNCLMSQHRFISSSGEFLKKMFPETEFYS